MITNQHLHGYPQYIKMNTWVYYMSWNSRWLPELNVYRKPLFVHNFVLVWKIGLIFCYLLRPTANFQKLLEITGNYQKLLKITKDIQRSQKRLEINDWSLVNLLLFIKFVFYINEVTSENHRSPEIAEKGKNWQLNHQQQLEIWLFFLW